MKYRIPGDIPCHNSKTVGCCREFLIVKEETEIIRFNGDMCSEKC